MRLAISELLIYILFRTVFQLPLSSGQIIDFDERVPINALVLGNLSKCRHKSYTAKTRFFELYFCQ